MFDCEEAFEGIALEAAKRGIRVENTYGDEAEVFIGDTQIGYLRYDQVEEQWVFSEGPLPLIRTDELIESILSNHQQASHRITFNVTIEYGAAAPEPTAGALETLAVLVQKSLTVLVPGKRKPKAINVNGHQRKLK